VERSDRDLELAESRILAFLDRGEATYSPRELVEHLKEADGEEFSEEAISVALWDLIGRTDIVLTRDWKLRPSKPPATV
jgi:hypothetical protein